MQLLDLVRAVVAHARPLGEARQRGFVSHPPPKLTRGFGQPDPVAALSERERTFQASRSGSDHEHRGIGALGLDPFGMPAAAPLLAHSRVLRASHGRLQMLPGHADIAADAFADVVETALLDLAGNEGIGDRRAGAADEVCVLTAEE